MIIIDYNTGENLQDKLWQYDYGETLRIQGGNLQKAQEIHFSLSSTGGNSITRIGVTKDNATDVIIPDSLLENDSEIDYLIYVFLYNRDSTSGETTKKFILSVKARAKLEHSSGTDGNAFGEVLEEVRKSAERAEAAETKAKEYETQTKADATQTALDREKVKEMVDTVSDISAQVETVKGYTAQAQTAATDALLSEQESEKAKQSALQAQAGAETAEGMAEQHALDVAGDKAEVERMTTQVREDKTSVEQTVQGFDSTVAEQISNVQETGTQEAKKVTDEGAKQVQAVEKKGQQILDSITEIQVNNPSTTYTLQPNIQVVWGEVAELNLTLAPEKPNAINIYPFWFTSGATPTKVTLPVGIILDGFVTKPNKKYCCQIEQNVLFWKEFEVVA